MSDDLSSSLDAAGLDTPIASARAGPAACCRRVSSQVVVDHRSQVLAVELPSPARRCLVTCFWRSGMWTVGDAWQFIQTNPRSAHQSK